MSRIAQQESLVRESLFHFVRRNIPAADLNVIDEIVLAYVISILEEASQDPCFDVDGFIDMMSAYLPEFSHIDGACVCSWVYELEAELMHQPSETSDSSDGGDSASGSKISLTLESLSEMLPSLNEARRSHTSSEGSEASGRKNCVHGWDSCDDCGSERRVEEAATLTEEFRALHEMFPNSCSMEIKHCISIANGDMERAAQTLLHRRENGQSLSAGSSIAAPAAPRRPRVDDNELKNRIIARYSYVDKNSDMKEHKPLAPKIEPKKLVRYRDNKIVSLKGERYTEVPKSGIDDEHLKKPKKQHCP